MQGIPRHRRTSDLALPATSEEAKTLLELAGKAAADARKALREAEAVYTQVQEHHAKCREDHAGKHGIALNRRKRPRAGRRTA